MSIMSRIVTGDGIDITSSQDVEVKNCFIRSTDDSICIKSQRLFEDPSTVRDVTKVRVHNNVIWNAEPGNAIELGYAPPERKSTTWYLKTVTSYTASMKETWVVRRFPSIRQMAVMFMIYIIKISE